MKTDEEKFYQEYVVWKIQWAMDAHKNIMDGKEKIFLLISGNLKRNDSFLAWQNSGGSQCVV